MAYIVIISTLLLLGALGGIWFEIHIAIEEMRVNREHVTPNKDVELLQNVKGTWVHHSYRPEGHLDVARIEAGLEPDMKVQHNG